MSYITCNYSGGLGNQLFQAGHAYAVAKRCNKPFYATEDFIWDCGAKHPSTYYNNLLKKIPRRSRLDHPTISLAERGWTAYNILPEVNRIFEHHQECNLKLIGNYQSDQCFYGLDAEIKELFTPDEGIREWLANTDLITTYPELFSEEGAEDRCFIGVRRTDYVTKANFHNPCGMTYFTKAMDMMGSKKFYIASDDIAWCKQKFVGDQYVFMEIEDDITQFYAGCLFKNYIIANSTYHWWMSFLSVFQGVRVIAPDKWIFGSNARWNSYSTIYRKGMEIVERPVEI
jgi:hypothetical protein